MTPPPNPQPQPTLEEIAERITVEVAKICGCEWERCTEVREATTTAILEVLRNERERAAKSAEKTILHLADAGISELNWQDLYNIPAAIREGRES